MMTLKSELQKVGQHLHGNSRTWQKVYDSLKGRYIHIRKIHLHPEVRTFCRSDAWKVMETGEVIYSPRGICPLYITFLE